MRMAFNTRMSTCFELRLPDAAATTFASLKGSVASFGGFLPGRASPEADASGNASDASFGGLLLWLGAPKLSPPAVYLWPSEAMCRALFATLISCLIYMESWIPLAHFADLR